jgi:hypothetical protein
MKTKLVARYAAAYAAMNVRLTRASGSPRTPQSRAESDGVREAASICRAADDTPDLGFSLPSRRRGILEGMTKSAGAPRHLASSPFQPHVEPPIEEFAVGDLVSHDSYGMGRVIQLEAAAVTVDFRSQTVRVTSPYRKMSKL